jgi:hypothetical protein
MKILLHSILFISFFSGCCHLKSKADIYQWGKNSKNVNYYLNSGNIAKGLDIKLKFQESYFPYESKIGIIILRNFGSDTVLVNGVSNYNFDLYNDLGKLVKGLKVQAQVSSSQRIIVDECGRKILPMELPKIKIFPSDSLVYDSVFVLNRYGDKFATDLLHRAGYIPFYLEPGKYKATLKHQHKEISKDLKPRYVYLKPDTAEFRVDNIPDSLKQETNNYIDLAKAVWVKDTSDVQLQLMDFKKKYPNSIYNNLIKGFIALNITKTANKGVVQGI